MVKIFLIIKVTELPGYDHQYENICAGIDKEKLETLAKKMWLEEKAHGVSYEVRGVPLV